MGKDNEIVNITRSAETYSKLFKMSLPLNADVKMIQHLPAPRSGKLFGTVITVKDMVAVKGQWLGSGNPLEIQFGAGNYMIHH
jgi:hypothetical protein